MNARFYPDAGIVVGVCTWSLNQVVVRIGQNGRGLASLSKCLFTSSRPILPRFGVV